MRILCTLSIGLILSLTQIACQQQEKKQSEYSVSQKELSKARWQLIDFPDEQALPSKKEMIPFIEFLDNNTVSGFAGCNRFQAKLALNMNRLQFTPMMMTKRYCLETMELENHFSRAMERVSFADISGETLILFDENKNKLLKFKGKTR